MVKIIKLETKRWKEYKKLRLFALKNEEFAFLSTVEDDLKLMPKDWKKRLNTCFFAEENKKLIGMVAISFSKKEKTKHVCELVALFVLPEYRKNGVAKKLLDYFIKECKKNKIKKITLDIISCNTAAKKFYLKNGFKIVGVFKKEFFINKKYFDEVSMEKFI